METYFSGKPSDRVFDDLVTAGILKDSNDRPNVGTSSLTDKTIVDLTHALSKPLITSSQSEALAIIQLSEKVIIGARDSKLPQLRNYASNLSDYQLSSLTEKLHEQYVAGRSSVEQSRKEDYDSRESRIKFIDGLLGAAPDEMHSGVKAALLHLLTDFFDSVAGQPSLLLSPDTAIGRIVHALVMVDEQHASSELCRDHARRILTPLLSSEGKQYPFNEGFEHSHEGLSLDSLALELLPEEALWLCRFGLSAEDPDLRELSVEMLGRSADPSAREWLVSEGIRSSSEQEEINSLRALALAGCNDERTVAILEHYLHSNLETSSDDIATFEYYRYQSNLFHSLYSVGNSTFHKWLTEVGAATDSCNEADKWAREVSLVICKYGDEQLLTKRVDYLVARLNKKLESFPREAVPKDGAWRYCSPYSDIAESLSVFQNYPSSAATIDLARKILTMSLERPLLKLDKTEEKLWHDQRSACESAALILVRSKDPKDHEFFWRFALQAPPLLRQAISQVRYRSPVYPGESYAKDVLGAFSKADGEGVIEAMKDCLRDSKSFRLEIMRIFADCLEERDLVRILTWVATQDDVSVFYLNALKLLLGKDLSECEVQLQSKLDTLYGTNNSKTGASNKTDLADWDKQEKIWLALVLLQSKTEAIRNAAIETLKRFPSLSPEFGHISFLQFLSDASDRAIGIAVTLFPEEFKSYYAPLPDSADFESFLRSPKEFLAQAREKTSSVQPQAFVAEPTMPIRRTMTAEDFEDEKPEFTEATFDQNFTRISHRELLNKISQELKTIKSGLEILHDRPRLS